MKNKILIFAILMSLYTHNILAQCSGNNSNTTKPTSIGIIIYSSDAETLWNAFRFANYSKTQGDTVSVFLLGKGVELDSLVKTKNNIKEQTDIFTQNGGTILACGTCLRNRNIFDPKICIFSSMIDLYDLVRKNRIVLTF